jgi:hypothetical protein
MRRSFFSIITALAMFAPVMLPAQVLIETANNAREPGDLIVYGSADLQKKLTYANVKGSPFWNNDWKMATLIDKDNKTINKAKVRLNLYSNEVHFLNTAGKELVVVPGLVRKVVIHKDDQSEDVLAVFENEIEQIVEFNIQAENSSYVQILNFGDIQLLKHTRKTIGSADSLFGTMKRYYFSEQVMYYVNDKYGKMQRLNKLNQNNLMDVLPMFNRHANWIAANKINFKKEEDVVRFLDYYNAYAKEKGLKQ